MSTVRLTVAQALITPVLSSEKGIRFYTRAKAITSRWPDSQYQEHHRTHMHFPTAS